MPPIDEDIRRLERDVATGEPGADERLRAVRRRMRRTISDRVPAVLVEVIRKTRRDRDAAFFAVAALADLHARDFAAFTYVLAKLKRRGAFVKEIARRVRDVVRGREVEQDRLVRDRLDAHAAGALVTDPELVEHLAGCWKCRGAELAAVRKKLIVVQRRNRRAFVRIVRSIESAALKAAPNRET